MAIFSLRPFSFLHPSKQHAAALSPATTAQKKTWSMTTEWFTTLQSIKIQLHFNHSTFRRCCCFSLSLRGKDKGKWPEVEVNFPFRYETRVVNWALSLAIDKSIKYHFQNARWVVDEVRLDDDMDEKCVSDYRTVKIEKREKSLNYETLHVTVTNCA